MSAATPLDALRMVHDFAQRETLSIDMGALAKPVGDNVFITDAAEFEAERQAWQAVLRTVAATLEAASC